MKYPWYRMYAEARTDAKLRTLSAEQFRVWFNLLCLASEPDDARGAIAGLDDDLLAVEVADGDVDLLRQTLAKLVKLRIVQEQEDEQGFSIITFLSFEKRQYDKPSDQPSRVAARVAAHRARHAQDGIADVTPRNASVTPQNASNAYMDMERQKEIRPAAAETRARTHLRARFPYPLTPTPRWRRRRPPPPPPLKLMR